MADSTRPPVPDLTIDPAELDDITGPAALTWAKDWSDLTESAYETTTLAARIRTALDTDDRIPYVTRRGEHLYNFWRDHSHPRGVWRRTTLESYLADSTEWDAVLDIDDLAAAEGEDWVWKGASVRPIANDRALVRLSRGGADAVVVREFDLAALTFVDNGFTLPEAKSDVSWLDRDTLLVGTDLGADSVTTSGYPVEVRVWRRGELLVEAPVVFRGEPDDVAVGAGVDHTPGHEGSFSPARSTSTPRKLTSLRSIHPPRARLSTPPQTAPPSPTNNGSSCCLERTSPTLTQGNSA